MEDRLIESERLFLRRIVPTDEADLFSLDSNPDVVRYIRPPVRELEETREKIRKTIADYDRFPGLGLFPAFRKEDGGFVGCFVIRPFQQEGGRDTEVGYALQPAAWGKGYAAEMTSRLVEYGFTTIKANKLVAVVEPLNIPSQKVLEKTGFRYIKDLLHKGIVLRYYEISPA